MNSKEIRGGCSCSGSSFREKVCACARLPYYTVEIRTGSKFDNIAISHRLRGHQNCKFAISPGAAATKMPQMPVSCDMASEAYVCRQWMFGDEAALRHHAVLLT